MTNTRDQLKSMMPDSFRIFFEQRNPYDHQLEVMPNIVKGFNQLLSAPTASGKSEAVLAPLYQRHISFRRTQLSTIYVAPTKALVNDMFERLNVYLGTHSVGLVARYTGDRHEFSLKDGVFCLLVTPEGLDSLQLRRPDELVNVRAVVIDEIHLLHGQARGQQLRHVIERIKKSTIEPKSDRDNFQIVGMTATINDLDLVADTWLGKNAKISKSGDKRDIDLRLLEIDDSENLECEYSKKISEWLKETNTRKVLVFTNTRNLAHKLAVYLKQDLTGTRWPVHLHFGTLPANEREHVEEKMKNDEWGLCVATSTLEIGIDIGDIDCIILADIPKGVNSFLQRIGRGNRRTGECKVLGFTKNDEEKVFYSALLNCAQAGVLDDLFEYDRPSVRYQQVLSLVWKATRSDQAISVQGVLNKAGSSSHETVIQDMIDTDALKLRDGFLVPNDHWMEEGDKGRIHTVISGASSGKVIDSKTGEVTMRDPEPDGGGSIMYHRGKTRRLERGDDERLFLGEAVEDIGRIAKVRTTRGHMRVSKGIVQSMARIRGHNPKRWKVSSQKILTFGGETLNMMLAKTLSIISDGVRLSACSESVDGVIPTHLVSIEYIRSKSVQIKKENLFSSDFAKRFTNPSRYISKLSADQMEIERQNSVPWPLFFDWLDENEGLDFNC